METFIKNIIKKAGKKALDWFKKGKLTSMRGTSKEVVTEYDKQLDEFIIERIEDKYPDHNLLTEESGEINKDSEYTWIVDSLDGSGNFANKNPLFSICISLMKEDEIQLGAIYAPALEEFYFAQKDKGAYLNGEEISVSGNEKLENSYVIYCEGNEKDKKRIAQAFSNIYPASTDTRKIGSAGIETAWIASGRVDGYYTFSIDPWDVASGVLLVKEAGGKVSGVKGNPWKPERMDLVFSNGKVHKEILEKL